MAVDMNVANSIIQAFNLGKQEKMQKEAEATRQKERAEQILQDAQKRQEDLDFREKQFNLAAKGAEIAQALQFSDERRKIADEIRQFGPQPGDTEVGRTGSIPLSPGRATTAGIFERQVPGIEEPFRTTALSPKDFAEQQAEIQRLLAAPQNEIQRELKMFELETDLFKMREQHLMRLEESAARPTEVVLAERAAQGDQVAENALQRLKQQKINPIEAVRELQASDILDGMQSGIIPASLEGISRTLAGPILQEASRRGYDYTSANTDWRATTRWLSSANATGQLRLRQAISVLKGSNIILRDVFNDYKKIASGISEIRIINRANLFKAQQMGGEVGAAAQALISQINTMIGELGVVYMGGNSPTDAALAIAAEDLKTDWGETTMLKAMDLLDKNLDTRINSILTSGPAGLSGTQYVPPGISVFGGMSHEEAAQEPDNVLDDLINRWQ